MASPADPIDELVVAIARMGRLPLKGEYSAQARVHDLYEVFVFECVLAAASALGATPTYQDAKGPRADLQFRTQPGRLQASSPAITWANLSLPRKGLLQVHNGVMIRGYRGTSHECDVAVITLREALWSRLQFRDPRSREGLVLAAECKYRAKRSVGLGEARALLGLASELSYPRTGFASNRPSPSAEDVFMRRWPRFWGFDLWPGREAQFVSDLEVVFREYDAS